MNDSLIRACRLERPERRPVWFMRQAGRYLKEYREIRKNYSVLELCRRPEEAAEISALPVNRFDLDAAIVFSDIMIPLTGMNADIRIIENEGPKVAGRIENAEDVQRLREFDPSTVQYVYEAVERTRRMLSDRVPVIGFAGGPFTLSSYLIEGSSSRDFMRVKKFMYRKRELWDELMGKLADMCISHLQEQHRAGCRVLQLFDSWAGTLSAADYMEYVRPYTEHITRRLSADGAIVIHFITGNPSLVSCMACRGVSAVSVDWRVNIRDVMDALPDLAVQGNLEPALMMAPKQMMLERASRILAETEGRPGHIFNLGHGMPAEADVENVEALVKLVHGEMR